MFILRLTFLKIIIIMIFIKISSSLRCRTEDGPSDGELKRVARSCMRKFGDVAFAQSSQQQQNPQYQERSRQRVTNRENHGFNYEDSKESENDDFDDDQYYNIYNNNRNYNRQQNGYNNNNNYNERNGHGSNDSHNDERQRNRSHYNSYNQNRTTSGNNNNNWNYQNQRNSMNNSTNSRATTSYNNKNANNNYNNPNNSFSDVACIVHCFFLEMHMLNNDDYPDRHKMLYILTKDLRDRELRNFYADTIQECFRYLENQRRRDKCQFSRDLITCMTEYAKGNCDDWNEFNMMFN